MSKKLFISAVAPQKDKVAAAYFFRNLDYFIRNKKTILQKKEFYFAPLAGTGVSGLFVGDYNTCVGELLQLYEGPWKIEKNKETFYLIHISGSPLSGCNSCTFWSVEQQKCVSGNMERFSQAFLPLLELRKRKKTFFDNLPVSQRMHKMFLRLYTYNRKFSDDQARQKEQERQKSRIENLIRPAPDKNGFVAVMRYCQEGNLNALKTVWQYDKAQFDLRTKDGSGVLNFAAKQLSVLRFLIAKGKTAYGVSPIGAACEIKEDIVKRLNLLFKIGADIDEKNEYGEPPIVVAAESFNPAAVRWLIRNGADLSATNLNGETAYDIILKNKNLFDWKRTLKLLRQKMQAN